MIRRIVFLFCILLFIGQVSGSYIPLSLNETIINGNSYDVKNKTINGVNWLFVSEGGGVKAYNLSKINASGFNTTQWLDESIYVLIPTNDMVRAINFSDNFLIIGSSNSITIANISNMDNVSILSNTEVYQAGLNIEDLTTVTVDNKRYIIVSRAGSVFTSSPAILYFNATNTSNLTLVNTTYLSNTTIRRLHISGDILFAGSKIDAPGSIYNSNYTLYLYNISNPENPVYISHLRDPVSDQKPGSKGISGITSVGTIVYVAKYYNSIYAYDFSNRTNLVKVWNITGNYVDANIYNNTLYTTVRYSSYKRFNISNSSDPTLLGENTYSSAYVERMTIANGKVWISATTQGIMIYDDLTYVRENIIPVIGDVYSIARYGNYIYFGSRNTWINIINKTTFKTIDRYGSLPVMTRWESLIVNNTLGIMYGTVVWAGGLQILDITDPENLTILNPTTTRIWNTDVGLEEVGTDHLYSGIYNYSSGTRQIGIYNISNKTNPQQLKTFEVDTDGDAGIIRFIRKYNDTILMVTSSQGLFLVDITDRANPITIAIMRGDHYGVIGDPAKTAIYTYNASKTRLESLNVSNITAPTIRKSITTQGSVYDFTHIGDLLYATNTIQVFDIADADNVNLIDFNNYGYGSAASKRIVSDGTYLYTGDSNALYKFASLGDFYIINLAVIPGLKTAFVTWNTNNLSDSTVYYGVVSGQYYSSVNDSTNVTSHSITIAGLVEGTKYYYYVSSTNGTKQTNSIESSFTTLTQEGISPDASIPGWGNRLNLTAFTTINIDNITTDYAMGFTAQQGTITNLSFRPDIITGNPGNYTIGLKTNYTDTAWLSSVEYDVVVTEWQNITNPYVVPETTRLYFVIQSIPGNQDTNNKIRTQYGIPRMTIESKNSTLDTNMTVCTNISSTWSCAGKTPSFIVEYDDGHTYGQAWSTNTYKDIHVSKNQSQYAKLDIALNITGLLVNLGASSNASLFPKANLTINLKYKNGTQISSCSVTNASVTAYSYSWYDCITPSVFSLNANDEIYINYSSATSSAEPWRLIYFLTPYNNGMTFKGTNAYVIDNGTAQLSSDYVFLLKASTNETIPPNITSWTSWVNGGSPTGSLSYSVDNNSFVEFFVTSDQSINCVWDNVDYYDGCSGSKTLTSNSSISVYGQNDNGTSQTITWTITITESAPEAKPAQVQIIWWE